MYPQRLCGSLSPQKDYMKSWYTLFLISYFLCLNANADFFGRDNVRHIGKPQPLPNDALETLAKQYDVTGWLVRPSTTEKPDQSTPAYKIESYSDGVAHLIASNGERGAFKASFLDPRVIKPGIPKSQFKFFISEMKHIQVINDTDDYFVFSQFKEVNRQIEQEVHGNRFTGNVDQFGNVNLQDNTQTQLITVIDTYELKTQATFSNGILTSMKEVSNTLVSTNPR